MAKKYYHQISKLANRKPKKRIPLDIEGIEELDPNETCLEKMFAWLDKTIATVKKKTDNTKIAYTEAEQNFIKTFSMDSVLLAE